MLYTHTVIFFTRYISVHKIPHSVHTRARARARVCVCMCVHIHIKCMFIYV